MTIKWVSFDVNRIYLSNKFKLRNGDTLNLRSKILEHDIFHKKIIMTEGCVKIIYNDNGQCNAANEHRLDIVKMKLKKEFRK